MIYPLKITLMNWNTWKNTYRYCAVLVLFALWTNSNARAQNRGGREKLESAKIAHITERLALTPEIAQKFWPVYNQLNEKERELRKKEMEMRRDSSTSALSDDEAQTKLNQYFDLKQQQLDLEKNASQQYKGILSAKQVLQLFRAEEEFHRMVLQKFGERRRGNGPPNR